MLAGRRKDIEMVARDTAKIRAQQGATADYAAKPDVERPVAEAPAT